MNWKTVTARVKFQKWFRALSVKFRILDAVSVKQ